MAGESDDLDKLFESVADGESVDWDALERSAPDEESRALIRQLRLIAEVADVHRSQVDEVALTEDVSLTTPVGGRDHPYPRSRLWLSACWRGLRYYEELVIRCLTCRKPLACQSWP